MTPIVSDPIVAPPLAAAQTIDAVKVYGRGETTVWGLDGVSVALGSHQLRTQLRGPTRDGHRLPRPQRGWTEVPASARRQAHLRRRAHAVRNT